jgi:hypothetical protein
VSLPQLSGRGGLGESGTLHAAETMLGGCRGTRVRMAYVSLGWGAGVIEYRSLVHDELTRSIGDQTLLAA